MYKINDVNNTLSSKNKSTTQLYKFWGGKSDFFFNNISYELDYLFSSKELHQSASQTLSTA